jgi:SAM-dependent methyltransferase
MQTDTTDPGTLPGSAPSVRPFSSAAYWDARYRSGGTSGAGSYGRLAHFKAGFVNAFVDLNHIERVIEFGCGDGNQLSLLSVPHYTGVDVSPTVLDRCRVRFPGRHHRFVDSQGLPGEPKAGLGLSMDVIFHLTEDAVFAEYLRNLFAFAADFVIIYASDRDVMTPDAHVRHRFVSDYVRRAFREWSLLARVPNIYPFDPRRPNDTSFSDFMVFGRGLKPCRLLIPPVAPPPFEADPDLAAGALIMP